LSIGGPIVGEWFGAYVALVPAPTLKQGDVVVIDNLSSQATAARETIEAAGATMIFLPPYSPDFVP